MLNPMPTPPMPAVPENVPRPNVKPNTRAATAVDTGSTHARAIGTGRKRRRCATARDARRAATTANTGSSQIQPFGALESVIVCEPSIRPEPLAPTL